MVWEYFPGLRENRSVTFVHLCFDASSNVLTVVISLLCSADQFYSNAESRYSVELLIFQSNRPIIIIM